MLVQKTSQRIHVEHTHARLAALPEQIAERNLLNVLTPGMPRRLNRLLRHTPVERTHAKLAALPEQITVHTPVERTYAKLAASPEQIAEWTPIERTHRQTCRSTATDCRTNSC